jgi:hypothetical protein
MRSTLGEVKLALRAEVKAIVGAMNLGETP